MSDNTCSRCGQRPTAVQGVCRYCFGKRHLWKNDTAPVEVPAVEAEPVVDAPAEPEAPVVDEKPKPKRRARKKAD
jgi:DnaJ-class molecular chaperone